VIAGFEVFCPEFPLVALTRSTVGRQFASGGVFNAAEMRLTVIEESGTKDAAVYAFVSGPGRNAGSNELLLGPAPPELLVAVVKIVPSGNLIPFPAPAIFRFPVLALALPPRGRPWPKANQQGTVRTDFPDGRRESYLGCASDSR